MPQSQRQRDRRAHGDSSVGTVIELDREYFRVSEISNAIGESARTIRSWERMGLLKPARTIGGHRVYGKADLERARQVAYMRRTLKLSSASIVRQLGPVDGDDAAPVMANDPKFGRVIRRARTARGLSLTDLARRTGLSVSFLSAVELEQTGISLINLAKIASALGATVAGLQVIGDPDMSAESEAPHRLVVGGAGGSFTVEDLITDPARLRVGRVEISPGASSGASYEHAGEEFVYVLSGQLTFSTEAGIRTVGAGESIHLNSTRPHQWRNRGSEPTSVLWVNVSTRRRYQTRSSALDGSRKSQ